MPQATKYQANKPIKLLNMGDPGGGKTGALACLARAGYRLVIADFDNGVDIIVGVLKDDEEALSRIYYETFTDNLQMIEGMIITRGKPVAFTNAVKALNNWKFPIEAGSNEYYDLGRADSWGQDTILVIDSLGFAGIAALRLIRYENKHQMDKRISIPDYGLAMDRLEYMLQLLFSEGVKCHVIVNTHISYEDAGEGMPRQGLPRALGRKLPPKVGGYFNAIVRSKTEGIGRTQKRVIKTAGDPSVELKLPVPPGVVPETLPIEDGLLTIFKALRSTQWIEEKE